MSESKAALIPQPPEMLSFADRLAKRNDPRAATSIASLRAYAAIANEQPPAVPPINPIFKRIDRTYQDFFRHPVTGGAGSGDWKDFVVNARDDGQPGSIDLIVIPFVVPANYRCRVESNASLATTQCAITEHPGAILLGETNSWDRLGGLDSKFITWRSTPRVPQGNLLTPGQTCYLNFTSVNVDHYRQTGEIRPMQVGALGDRARSLAYLVP